MKKLRLIISISFITMLTITNNSFCMKRKRAAAENLQKKEDDQTESDRRPNKKRRISEGQEDVTLEPGKSVQTKYTRINHNETTRKLFKAIEEKDYATVEEILNDNPNIVKHQIGENHNKSFSSPLHLAIAFYTRRKQTQDDKKILYDIIELILENNANPNEKHRGKYTTLDRLLSKKNYNELISLLISKGANQYGNNTLKIMLQKGLLENTKILLDNELLNINKTSPEWGSLLHLSAGALISREDKTGRLNIKSMNFILKRCNGYIKNTIDNSGDTPLHIALRKIASSKRVNTRHIELLEKLITEENINKKNLLGEPPITPLFQTQYFNIHLVSFLSKKGAELRGNPGPYLHKAINNFNIDAIYFLINNGFYVNAHNRYGDTPLHLCCSYFSQPKNKLKLLKIAKLLIHNGALVNVNNNRRETPLSLAIRNSDIELSQLLIQNGADTNREETNKIGLLTKNGVRLGINIEQLTIDLWRYQIAHLKKLPEKQRQQEFAQIPTEDRRIVYRNIFALTPEHITKMSIQDIKREIEKSIALRALYKNSLIANKFIYLLLELVRRTIQSQSLTPQFDDAIKGTLADLDILVNGDKLVPYNKLHILNTFAQLDLTDKLNAVNQKLKSRISFDWIKLLRTIPFNSIIISRNWNYLTEIANRMRKMRDETGRLIARDINNETFSQVRFKHIMGMYCGMLDNWPLFFTEYITQIGTPYQISPLLKNLLLGQSRKDQEEKNPFIKEIAKRVMPLQVRGNRSYHQNHYHRTFVNLCSMFTMLQSIKSKGGHFFGGGLADRIMSNLHPKDLFDGKSYIPHQRKARERSIFQRPYSESDAQMMDNGTFHPQLHRRHRVKDTDPDGDYEFDDDDDDDDDDVEFS